MVVDRVAVGRRTLRRLVALLALVGALMACGTSPAPQPAATLRVVPEGIDATRMLSSLVTKAKAAGGGQFEPLGAAVLVENEQLGSFVEVPADDCLLAFARAGTSVRDVDLFAYSDGGDRLAADEAPLPDAAVVVCPPHPRRVYVTARVMAGSGVVALGVMTVSPETATAVARVVGAPQVLDDVASKLQAWANLERRVRERRNALGSRWEDVRRVAVPLDPRAHTAVSVPIGASRCLDVLVLPSDEVRSIDAMVVGRNGRVVARANPAGRDRSFVLCSSTDQALTVMVRPRISRGIAAVVIGRSPKGSVQEIAERHWVDGGTPLLPLARAVERNRERLEVLGVGKEVGSGQVALGSVATVALQLEAGCTRLDVVGGLPLGPFEASLWRDDGKLVGRSHASEHAALFWCGPAAGARLEVSAVDSGGPFSVQSRAVVDPPSLLVAHPLAAAQLLSRLDAVVGPIDARAATGATLVDTSGLRRASQSLNLAKGNCADIVVAPIGASGAMVRVVAADASAPMTRGRSVVAAVACAGTDHELSARFEVATTSARASQALVLVRSR